MSGYSDTVRTKKIPFYRDTFLILRQANENGPFLSRERNAAKKTSLLFPSSRKIKPPKAKVESRNFVIVGRSEGERGRCLFPPRHPS